MESGGYIQIDKEIMNEDKIVALYHKRKKYRENFHAFCWDILGYRDMNPIHENLSSFLSTPKRNKLILMPRFTFKSCIATIGYTLWRLTKDYNLRVLIYSDATAKAKGFLGSIKNHIEGKVTGSAFRETFGHWEVDPKKDKWNQEQIVIGFRRNAQAEPSVDTAGQDASKIGFHYDLIIFDDIVSDQNVTTKEQMDKTVNCYKKSLSLLKPGGEIIIVGTRWHFGDLYGRLLAENEERPLFETFIECAYEGDRYFFDDIGENSLTKARLELLKKQQGSYVFSCNTAEAPILMADWTYKPIVDVKVGDEVVGWSVEKNGTKPRLKISKVLAKGERNAEVVKVCFDSGRIIRCTPDHNWYSDIQIKNSKFWSTSRYNYYPAEIGRGIVYLNDISRDVESLTPDEKENLSWLSGIYDGEGSSDDQTIRISQSEKHNPEIREKIKSILMYFRFDYGEDKSTIWINGGLQERHRFLTLVNPVRKHMIIRTLWKCDFTKNIDRVKGIWPLGETTVYSMQTETGNYIAWGYGSKNCLYQNSPVDDETATFKARDFSFAEVQPTDLYITATIDPAGKGEDSTAITVIGTDNEMNMYILEIVNEKLTPSEMIEKVISLNYKYKFKIFGIETNFFRGMLKLELERRVGTEHSNSPTTFPLFGIHEFLATSRRGENKHSRIRGLQPYHERGAIKFPGKRLELLTGPFSELAYQMIQFPNAPFDDILDALANQIILIRKGGVAKKKDLPHNSPAWLERELFHKEMSLRNRLPRRARSFVAPLSLS